MIQQLLDKYRFQPDEHRDQHFLNSERILQEAVDQAEIENGDVVLEIGAGMGILTHKLAEQAQNVYAVENDEKLIKILRNEFENHNNVEIIHGDIMSVEWPEYDKCVSNPPYHLSSELVEMLGERQKLSVLSFQQEFAERLVAEPGSSDYSRLTVMANYYFIPVYLQDIPSSAFYPPPDVDSALVKLFPRPNKFGIEDKDRFFRIVKALFIHRRKKVRNAFVDSRHIFEIEKDTAKQLRDKLPYSEERVINLHVKQLAELAAKLDDMLED